jgi:hypothetical protein
MVAPAVQVRFQKKDQYDNLIFIASGKSSDQSEVRAFNRLKKIHSGLKKQYPDSYLPVYYNSDTGYTATLKFKDWSNLKPTQHSVYKIKFNILSTKKDENDYLRVGVDEIKFVRKATLQGNVVQFDISDSDSE